MASAASGATGPDPHVETLPPPVPVKAKSTADKTGKAAMSALDVEPIEGEKKETKPLEGRARNLQEAIDAAKDCKTTDEFKKAVGEKIFGDIRRFRTAHDTQLESREKINIDAKGAYVAGWLAMLLAALVIALIVLAIVAPGGAAIGVAIAASLAANLTTSTVNATEARGNVHKDLKEAEKKLVDMDSPQMRKLLARYDTVAQHTVVGQLSHPKNRDMSSIDEAKGETPKGNVSDDVDALGSTVNGAVPNAEEDPDREDRQIT